MKCGGHKGGKKTISDEVAHSVESHGKKNLSNSSLMKTVLSFYSTAVPERKYGNIYFSHFKNP